MAELLLELFSEEIPARMQARAADDLAKAVLKGLGEAGVSHGAHRALYGPRRLTLVVADMPMATAPVSEELKGPRVDAPEKALEGFLRKTGLSRDALEVREDKKGATYFARLETPGRETEAVLADLVPAVVRAFPWPKSMRWGAGELRWVRPLRSILCLLSEPGSASVVPPIEIEGVSVGAVTYGHRFLGRAAAAAAATPGAALEVASFADYEAQLARAFVVVDAAERRARIEKGLAAAAADAGLELLPDPGLLAETTGLAEWPTPLSGAVDPVFQSLPPEVLQTSMREHQKFFALRDPGSGAITRFVTVANVAPADGGAKVIAGNERVLRARLADAAFFYEADLARPLDSRVEALASVTYHNQLGSQAARIARLRALAADLAPSVGAAPELADRAALLAKADLATEMVYEFPELQGVMGRRYAEAAGEDPSVSAAIAEHYAPLGPSDAAPSAPVSIAVALADKLDALVAFWTIGAKPTGSGDPFALRRAALGALRIIVENDVRLDLFAVAAAHGPRVEESAVSGQTFGADAAAELDAFLADRLKGQLREMGVRRDVAASVIALAPTLTDVARAKKRMDAVGGLIASEDGENLLAAHKRANNILEAEEKKDGVEYSLDPIARMAEEPAEIALFEALDAAEAAAEAALKIEDDTAAAAAMAALRAPLDAFFETVVVNAPSAPIRRNRLCLLNRIRRVMNQLADFSHIEG